MPQPTVQHVLNASGEEEIYIRPPAGHCLVLKEFVVGGVSMLVKVPITVPAGAVLLLRVGSQKDE